MRLLLAVAMVGACATPAIAAAAPAVSFSADVVPMLRARCVACHMTGAEPGEIVLTPKKAHASLVGTASTEAKLLRVKPGDPAKSYLLHKLAGTHLSVGGSGMRMPFGGPPLDQTMMTKLRAWIAAGAPNN